MGESTDLKGERLVTSIVELASDIWLVEFQEP
jgi:hypothetical protein